MLRQAIIVPCCIQALFELRAGDVPNYHGTNPAETHQPGFLRTEHLSWPEEQCDPSLVCLPTQALLKSPATEVQQVDAVHNALWHPMQFPQQVKQEVQLLNQMMTLWFSCLKPHDLLLAYKAHVSVPAGVSSSV